MDVLWVALLPASATGFAIGTAQHPQVIDDQVRLGEAAVPPAVERRPVAVHRARVEHGIDAMGKEPGVTLVTPATVDAHAIRPIPELDDANRRRADAESLETLDLALGATAERAFESLVGVHGDEPRPGEACGHGVQSSVIADLVEAVAGRPLAAQQLQALRVGGHEIAGAVARGVVEGDEAVDLRRHVGEPTVEHPSRVAKLQQCDERRRRPKSKSGPHADCILGRSAVPRPLLGSRPMSLRVLFTNHQMAGRGGTQMWIRDIAGALVARGHRPVVWSPQLGASADDVRALGVPVIDDLQKLAEPPDLIHGHHRLETAAALAHFPGVAALFVCHGWLPWQEQPPVLPRIRRYLAVDRLRRERLVAENGIPPERVAILPNFVDLRRLPEASLRPSRPRRALLYSNRTDDAAWVDAVRAACRRNGLAAPALVGAAAGNAVDDPGRLFSEHDLVFARGRSALEAMATGATVVLCDVEGSGPRVTPANFAELADLNFGVGALRLPHDGAPLAAAIAGYDAEEAAAVARLVRQHGSLELAVERLLAVYRDILDEPCAGEPGAAAAEEGRAIARLLTELSRTIDPESGARLTAMERELASLRSTRAFRMRERLLRSPLRRLFERPSTTRTAG